MTLSQKSLIWPTKNIEKYLATLPENERVTLITQKISEDTLPAFDVFYYACLSNNAKLINEHASRLSCDRLSDWLIRDKKILNTLSEFNCLNALIILLNLKINETQNLKSLLKFSDFRAFILSAAKKGHLEILQHCETHLSAEEKKQAIKANDYKAIQCAATSGHLETLQHCETHLSEEEKKQAVKANNYEAIRMAAFYGQLGTLQHFETHLSEEEKKQAVKANDYEAIRMAAKNGHLETLQHCETHLSEEEKKQAVKIDDYWAIQWAAQNGHLETLQHCETYLSEEEKKEAVKINDYWAIRWVAGNDHLEILEHCETHLSEEEKKEAVKIDEYGAIRWAAGNDHLEKLQHYETHLSEEEKKQAIKANDYRAIQWAAENGHLETLQHCETHLSEEEKKQAVKANDYEAIRMAAKNGHLETLQHCETHLSEEEKKQAVKIDDYWAIQWAAKNGHLETLQHCETHLSEEEKKQAVKTGDYEAIRRAAENGHLETLQHCETHLSEEEKKQAIKARDYYAIRRAAQYAHLEILQHCETHLSEEEKKQAIKANDYKAIQCAATSGHLETLQHCETHLSEEEKKQAVKIDDYEAISRAAKNGHLEILQHYATHLSEEEKKQAVKAGDYWAIRWAADNGHHHVIDYLIHFKPALSYLEKHCDEPTFSYVKPLVSEKLDSIKHAKEQYNLSEPNGVFDLGNERAELCFYLLRNLIRRGVNRISHPAENCDEDIQFLLSIPSVRALCHRHMGEDDSQDNELLRFAIRIGNESAISMLMNIPNVQRLAEQNNFYQNEATHGFDLRAIARNRESSMVALSVTERKLVDNVKSHYQSDIDKKGGLLNAFDCLKNDLKERFLKEPPNIEDENGKSIPLPFEWSELQILRSSLNDTQYEKALKKYYQNTYHTVYRYLSKPNYWMHPNASYVYVDEQNPNLRYATFEDYISIIVPFYFAVIDNSAPAIDGYTLEGRIELFFKELALIARAHNWDKSRIVLNDNDEPLVDENGAIITEEYDDLEADKPSCYSGVLSRLFQSVLGHGAFKILTRDMINLEIREFARQHFETIITEDNREDLKNALDYLTNDTLSTDEPTDDEIKSNREKRKLAEQTLKSIDIEDNKIEDFKEMLTTKYLQQFSDNKTFQAQINRRFKQKEIFGSDFQVFNKEIGLEKLLIAPDTTKAHANKATPTDVKELTKDTPNFTTSDLAKHGFFTNNSEENSVNNTPTDDDDVFYDALGYEEEFYDALDEVCGC